MNTARMKQLMTEGLPEFMAAVCDAVAADLKQAGLDGMDMATLWHKHAPEKSRAWMRDVMQVCRERGQAQLAYCGAHYLWCLPSVVDQVQADLNARFAAEMIAARLERAEREARAAALIARPATADDEHDSWPVVRSLVSAADCRPPRTTAARSVFELGAAA